MNWPVATGVSSFLYKLMKYAFRKARLSFEPPPLGPGTEMVKCPRCYTYVAANGSIPTRVDGFALNFCSKECLEAYRRDHQDIDAAALDEEAGK